MAFQTYRDLEAGDSQSLKIQVGRPGIEPRSSCSASQELNHSATAAPLCLKGRPFDPERGGGGGWQTWLGQIIYFHHGLDRKIYFQVNQGQNIYFQPQQIFEKRGGGGGVSARV